MTSATRLARWAVMAAAVTAALTLFVSAVPRASAQVGLKRRPSRALTVEPMNETPGWAVRVSVDRPDHIYRPGDYVIAEVVSERDGYLYLLNIDASNEITLLFPNGTRKDNAIKANTATLVPNASDGFKLKVVAEATGTEYIKAIVTKDPLPSVEPLLKGAMRGKPIAVPEARYRAMLREAAFGKLKPARETGNIRGDLALMKRQKIVPVEEQNKQSNSWSEAQIEVYTGNQPTPPKQGRRLALLVGISEYKNTNIRPLGCAHKDAIDMDKVLKGTCGFDNTTLLINDQASLSAIRDAFTNLVENSKPGDTVVVYWAGHGGRCSNVDGTEPDGKDEYLVPYDGSLVDDDDAHATMLMDKTFGRWIQELNGRHVVVIMDACHSGGQIEGMKVPARAVATSPRTKTLLYRGVDTRGTPPKQKWTQKHFMQSVLNRYKKLRRDIKKEDAAIMAACSPLQFAFEMKDGSNGVFTHFLMEYLRSAPSGITAADAQTTVAAAVAKYVSTEFPGSPQEPIILDETAQPHPVLKK